jgi:hypothetical protein
MFRAALFPYVSKYPDIIPSFQFVCFSNILISLFGRKVKITIELFIKQTDTLFSFHDNCENQTLHFLQ